LHLALLLANDSIVSEFIKLFTEASYGLKAFGTLILLAVLIWFVLASGEKNRRQETSLSPTAQSNQHTSIGTVIGDVYQVGTGNIDLRKTAISAEDKREIVDDTVGKVSTLLQLQMQSVRDESKEALNRDFPSGYTLFTLSGGTEKIVPFRDRSGALVSADWRKCYYRTVNDRLHIRLPEIALGGMRLSNCEIVLEKANGSFTELAVDTKAKGTIANIVFDSPNARFPIGMSDQRVATSLAVLVARIVRTSGYGEVIVLGLKAE